MELGAACGLLCVGGLFVLAIHTGLIMLGFSVLGERVDPMATMLAVLASYIASVVVSVPLSMLGDGLLVGIVGWIVGLGARGIAVGTILGQDFGKSIGAVLIADLVMMAVGTVLAIGLISVGLLALAI